MITALGAFALSLSSPTADESAADRSDSKKLLHCALRTPAGDLITSQLLGIKVDPNKPPFLVAYREGGSKWPDATGVQGILLIPTNVSTGFVEFQINNTKMFRLGNESGVRTAAIFTSKEGKPLIASAFGFCQNDELTNLNGPNASPISGESSKPYFEVDRWRDDCSALVAGPRPRMGYFKLDQGVGRDDHFYVNSSSVDGDIFRSSISVPREINKNSEHQMPGATMSIGHFAPTNGSEGPSGTDIGYIDEAEHNLTILVQFKNFEGSGYPAFGICGVRNFKEKGQ